MLQDRQGLRSFYMGGYATCSHLLKPNHCGTVEVGLWPGCMLFLFSLLFYYFSFSFLGYFGIDVPHITPCKLGDCQSWYFSLLSATDGLQPCENVVSTISSLVVSYICLYFYMTVQFTQIETSIDADWFYFMIFIWELSSHFHC